jgi:glycosyltransferase involved in cell wall biosynthesis
MTHVGVDLEQFVTDPYGSGIQRVLQYLAITWPTDLATAEFVVPHRDEFLLLSPDQAASLVGLAFADNDSRDVREVVTKHVEELADSVPRVRQGSLLACFGAWLLPEVSYLPRVLDRFALFDTSMPAAMIGYDALPMTDPANYRFPPGRGSDVSRYFRYLATCDAVVCISDYSRRAILDRLRRNRSLLTTVAHPGGDHVAVRAPASSTSGTPIHYLRVGTMDARKMPVEIAEAFAIARLEGVRASLTFIGKPSPSDHNINQTVARITNNDIGAEWITDASDAEVSEHMRRADVFLSFGVEGYGIPVWESLRQGVPVLYGGIQPAADLMAGLGAVRVNDASVQGIAEMFRSYSAHEQINELKNLIDPSAVPQWRQFTQAVVRATLASRDHSALGQ